MHTSSQSLKMKIEQAHEKPIVGALYYHYKNRKIHYKILAIALQEATEEICIVYQNIENGIIWVRALDNWSSLVNYEGKLIPRFSKVEL